MANRIEVKFDRCRSVFIVRISCRVNTATHKFNYRSPYPCPEKVLFRATYLSERTGKVRAQISLFADLQYPSPEKVIFPSNLFVREKYARKYHFSDVFPSEFEILDSLIKAAQMYVSATEVSRPCDGFRYSKYSLQAHSLRAQSRYRHQNRVYQLSPAKTNLPQPPPFSGVPREFFTFKLQLFQFFIGNHNTYADSDTQLPYAGDLLTGSAGQ